MGLISLFSIQVTDLATSAFTGSAISLAPDAVSLTSSLNLKSCLEVITRS